MEIKNILDATSEWMTPIFDATTKEAVKIMMTSCPIELKESFYKNLELQIVSC